MNKLVFSIASVIAGSVFAALPPAGPDSPSTVTTNGVEYTRRGTMSTKNYTVTDVDTQNMLKRGYNAFGVEEIDGEESKWDSIPSDIWKAAEVYIDSTTGKMKVRFPVKSNDGGDLIVEGQKVYVMYGMHISDSGYEYMTGSASTDRDEFIYNSIGKGGFMTNGSFCYGTNRNVTAGVDKFELPRGGKGETIQNSNMVFADRAWFTNFIIKAGIKTDAEVKTVLQGM